MSKPYSISEIRVAFAKEFNSLNKRKILEENTYLFDAQAIEGIEVRIKLCGDESVVIDMSEILDWEVKFDEIYIDDEILE